jgi:hypothetical protein
LYQEALIDYPLTSISLAEQLQREQADVITETALKICNTIKESIGKMNKTQIQGGVEAELKGLIGKLANLKGFGKIDLDKEEFEGLSRDATAVALEGDRDCRERLFNKMYDKLESPPDKATIYMRDGRRADLRIVQEHTRYTPTTMGRAGENYVCSANDTLDRTIGVNFEDDQLSITNSNDWSRERCNSEQSYKGEGLLECKTDIHQLDDAIKIGSGPHLSIYCLTGDCVRCYETSKYKFYNQDWINNESRNYKIDHFTIYVGGVEYIESDKNAFYRFVRALARLISGGSDEAFCKYMADSHIGVGTYLCH